MKTILFVDDEPNILGALVRSQNKQQLYKLLAAPSSAEALEILAQYPVDVVISDEQMPGMLGSEFLAVVAKRFPQTIRIILTGHANINTAMRAINQGEIYRFLLKPCHEADLAITIRQALEHQELMALSQKLLKENELQSNILRSLEKQHPGITKLTRDETGTLLLD
jgi:DNA-binding NtrC family response regulator